MKNGYVGKTTEVLFLLLILLTAGSVESGATSIISGNIHLPPELTNGYGHNQYYSVIFDGEGEAIVAAKLVMKNINNSDLKKVVLEIPGQNVRVINILQQTGSTGDFVRIVPVLNQLSDVMQITLNLPKTVKEDETVAILLYYKVFSYTDSFLGNFDFKFQTIRTEYDTNHVRVAVNVVEGYRLKGIDANVNYRTNHDLFAGYANKMAPKSFYSGELKDFSHDIMYQSGFVKTTYGLDPYENFVVEGKYGKSWFILYFWNIILTLAAVTLIVWLIVVGVRNIIDIRYANKTVVQKDRRTYGQHDGHYSTGIPLGEIALVSAISTLALLVVWFGGVYILQNIHRWLWYNYASVFAVLFAIIILFAVILAMFGGPVYIGIKYRARYGLATFALILLMLIVMSVFALLLFILLGRQYHSFI